MRLTSFMRNQLKRLMIHGRPLALENRVPELPSHFREIEELGVQVISQYAVLGPYDFISIVEAPDNETVARVSAELASRGSIKLMTLPAVPIDDFIAKFS